MDKKYLVFTLVILNVFHLFGQAPFSGSFLMSFISTETAKDYPMLWNIEPATAGGRMVLEIQDEMIKKGVSKRVLFSPKDSTWTMMMEFNNIKQGTRIHGAAMYRDTLKHKKITSKLTKEKKIIEGYNCTKYIIESETYSADVWTTSDVKFDLCKVYRLLSHCGMMSEFVRKGDWFRLKSFDRMVMEAVSTKKSTGETYSMKISMLQPNVLDTTNFNINGFKISDIPEGQSCGPMKEE